MNLLKIGDYIPPNITQYDVSFEDIAGADEQTEAGTTMREVIRQEAPKISVTCTMINQVQATAVLTAVKPAEFPVTYFSDGERTCMMKCTDKALSLVAVIEENTEEVRYFNVSISLEHC